MDQRVVTADNQAVIHQVALLGMSCTRMCGVERPDMRRVAEDLRGLQASGQVVQDEAVHLEQHLRSKKLTRHYVKTEQDLSKRSERTYQSVCDFSSGISQIYPIYNLSISDN
ncbi:hypothetical protein YC2023_023457 [Brassica napus]